jgi:hypothetical protein
MAMGGGSGGNGMGPRRLRPGSLAAGAPAAPPGPRVCVEGVLRFCLALWASVGAAPYAHTTRTWAHTTVLIPALPNAVHDHLACVPGDAGVLRRKPRHRRPVRRRIRCAMRDTGRSALVGLGKQGPGPRRHAFRPRTWAPDAARKHRGTPCSQILYGPPSPSASSAPPSLPRPHPPPPHPAPTSHPPNPQPPVPLEGLFLSSNLIKIPDGGW